MTQDEIIDMARDSDLCWLSDGRPVVSVDRLERFAKLVDVKATAREREACAELCENYGGFKDGHSCASSIRARGEA